MIKPEFILLDKYELLSNYLDLYITLCHTRIDIEQGLAFFTVYETIQVESLEEAITKVEKQIFDLLGVEEPSDYLLHKVYEYGNGLIELDALLEEINNLEK